MIGSIDFDKNSLNSIFLSKLKIIIKDQPRLFEKLSNEKKDNIVLVKIAALSDINTIYFSSPSIKELISKKNAGGGWTIF